MGPGELAVSTGLYDDLVPTAPAAAPKSSGIYDDLVPQQTIAASTASAAPTLGQQAARQGGLVLRAVANGVLGIPEMVSDAADSAINIGNDLVHGRNPVTNDQPVIGSSSRAFNDLLTRAGVPEPQTAGEKISAAVESGLAGGKMPIPEVGEPVPSNFLNPQQVEAQAHAAVVQRGQQAGYVVPPATSNPTGTNRMLETLAGKTATQQGAALANQSVTNAIAKRALGLNPDAPLTADSLAALRSEASQQGYAPIRDAGTITAPANFSQRLAAALTKYQGAERSFPGMGQTELSGIVQKVDRPTFDAGDAVDLTKILREKADTAFGNGDTGLGSGLRDISGTVEDALDQGLQAKGAALTAQGTPNQYGQAVQNFRNARRTIAQSYTVGNAMNPGSENVVAAKLAGALRKGAPLQGDLATAAEFANAFPRAVAEPTHSMGVSHLDTYGAIAGGLLGEHLVHSPAGIAAAAAIPLSRLGSKAYLLSRFGQEGAIPMVQRPPSTFNPAAALAGALNTQ